MKSVIYIILIVIVGSLVYNLTKINYQLGFFAEENQVFVIGLGSGICGFLLGLIILKYLQLKPNLENQSKKG